MEAKNHLDPRGLIVESAVVLADALSRELRQGADQIELSFVGLRGIPSSYFNVLLLRLIGEFGVEAINRRVNFKFDTDIQQQVFHRSFDAASKSAA